MNKYYGALVYNDEQIDVVAYNAYEGQQYIMGSEVVYKGNISEVKNIDELEQIAQSLNEKMGIIEDEIGTRIHRLDVIVDPEKFYYEAKSFSVDFDEVHTITQSDIDKMIDSALRYDTAKPEYTAANYTAVKYEVDGIEKLNPLATKGKHLVISGDLVFVDSQTLYPLERIVEESRYRQQNVIVSSHLLKYAAGFGNKEAIIEFGRMKMKFMTKNDDIVQNFNMDFGLGHIYMKVYQELLNTHSPEASERVVRYIQNNFKLTPITFDFEITDEILYSEVSELFKKIASEYVQGIILQVYKQGIQFKKIHSITNDYSNDEWIEFLKTFLEIAIEPLKVNSVSGNFKQDLKVYNAISITDKMRLKG